MGGGEIKMNHKITTDYMTEGLQERIDRLAYKIWSKKYEKNTKRLSK